MPQHIHVNLKFLYLDLSLDSFSGLGYEIFMGELHKPPVWCQTRPLNQRQELPKCQASSQDGRANCCGSCTSVNGTFQALRDQTGLCANQPGRSRQIMRTSHQVWCTEELGVFSDLTNGIGKCVQENCYWMKSTMPTELTEPFFFFLTELKATRGKMPSNLEGFKMRLDRFGWNKANNGYTEPPCLKQDAIKYHRLEGNREGRLLYPWIS